MMTISRRTLMQMMGAGAGALGTSFGKNSKALAARGKEMNILYWEGYNSAQVLDPFRKKEGATVKAESLTNDPTMINRLRAGETNVWDLINVNNAHKRPRHARIAPLVGRVILGLGIDVLGPRGIVLEGWDRSDARNVCAEAEDHGPAILAD